MIKIPNGLLPAAMLLSAMQRDKSKGNKYIKLLQTYNESRNKYRQKEVHTRRCVGLSGGREEGREGGREGERERERERSTQYSSSSTASRATNLPKFRLCNPQYSSSVSCKRLKESSGSLELSLLEIAECRILSLLLQCASSFFHLENDTEKVSLQGIGETKQGGNKNVRGAV